MKSNSYSLSEKQFDSLIGEILEDGGKKVICGLGYTIFYKNKNYCLVSHFRSKPKKYCFYGPTLKKMELIKQEPLKYEPINLAKFINYE